MKKSVITVFAAKNKDLRKAPSFEEVCSVHQHGILSDILGTILYDNSLPTGKDFYFGVVYYNHKPVSVCLIAKPKDLLPYTMTCTLRPYRNKGFATKALQVAFKKSGLAKYTAIKYFNSDMAAVIVKAGLKLAPSESIHEYIGIIT